ncbi:DDHD-domain-containing protein [Coniochaeta sp. PMI_546]|nr:DDHD-domain-containing protein [Coniochaeta sp. PMI_546]
MSPAPGDKKAEKSYLASAVDSINPWGGSRSSTPTQKDPQPSQQPPVNPGDHIINPLYGQSFRRYPPDCPRLNVQWFHAVDIPKRKPKFRKGLQTIDPDDKKPPAQPKKFVAFSPKDSKSIEAAYQKKLEEIEDGRASSSKTGVKTGAKRPRAVSAEDAPNTSLEDFDGDEGQAKSSTRVPVNEDFLFDVEIETRELGPVYWLGPVYDVRRGSWFYQEGSTLRPCEENLAAQLEEGYLKIKPWRYPPRKTVTPKPSSENLKADVSAQADGQGSSKAAAATAPQQHQPQTYRLFGTYMNSVATYQDGNTAWLSSDGVLSWVTSTVYERFAGGAYMSGVKVVRGYTEPKKAKEVPRPSTPTGTKSTFTEAEEKQQKLLKRRSAPPTARSEKTTEDEFRKEKEKEQEVVEPKTNLLTRQLSNLMPGAEARNSEEEEEAIRKRQEEQMEEDYTAQVGETQGREIEHLILITHGIGQLLSLRMESLNFVHDVNMLRKTLKTTYSSSDDLRALNSEIGESGPGNCRVQVLPVCWRHLLEFPKRREKKGEHDLSDTFNDEDEYPSLEDITIEGMAFARSLVSDLALDILLYQSAYREQICEIVLKESNRIYQLFMERNPDFKGKVHIMGHSLGSAIMFDILCRQKEKSSQEPARNPLRFWPSQDRYEPSNPKDLAFNFDVEDFYCLGSPIGLFQMLKGRNIAARHLPNSLPSESPLNPDADDPFFISPAQHHAHSTDHRLSPITGLPFAVSSPKIQQLYNIFHPSDPIAYRLEPLISKAMSSLKPQALPYTKKGIFGTVAPQGLTGIGAKVGQSVSGLWSSFSAGIASSLLNRSLGLTQEDVAALERQQAAAAQQANQSALQPGHVPSPAAGTNILGGGVVSPVEAVTDAARAEKAAERKRELALSRRNTGLGGKGERVSESGNEVTLIDDELETLFSRFQKKRADLAGGDDGKEGERRVEVEKVNWVEEEKRAAKLRREEMKVRALNRNGRVDYTIQESVLDFNPMNVIASHMSYWQDEDVAHFTLSQMLASKARTPKATTPKAK